MPSKKWVFEALVENERDSVGLIGYALYKNKKHLLAKKLRSANQSEEVIQQEVSRFHDQTLQTDSINDYREKATQFLSEIIQKVQDDEKRKHQKELDVLKKKYEKDIKAESTKVFTRIKSYQAGHRTVIERLGLWLLSGIPGLFSSTLILCLFYGLTMLFIPEEKRAELLRDALAEFIAPYSSPVLANGGAPTKP